MVVTNMTTAANLFHALRRQITWPFRKPLINFSPKANLRLPASYSHLSEFTSGGFLEIIDDASVSIPTRVKRILLCSGKIFFELMDRKIADQRDDVAVVRLEQIYPLPVSQLQALQKKYINARWCWVQEEPLNMGAAVFMKMNAHGLDLQLITRPASAATATGYAKVHAVEQKRILDEAFGGV
jgi:2-oxoglutarate dehydrogenase E1 component